MTLSVRLGWGGTQRAAAAAMLLCGLSGCTGSPLASPDISSTPVATPIVVNSTPASATPTPPRGEDPKTAETRRKAVRAIIEKARAAYPGHTAVIFSDLDKDTRVEFEPEARFESASLVKLPILAELYRQFEMGEHTPEETLVLLESQKKGGSGKLKDAPEGSQHTLAALGEAMVTESDNTATQMLTDLLSKEKVQTGATAMGMKGTTVQRDIFDFEAIDAGKDNYITAKDAALFLEQLARQELPGSPAMSEILERQKRKDMIGKGFPAEVRVAHKTGELDGILHDAGIVYAPRGNFILVCLSDQVSDKEAAKKVWSAMASDLLKLYSQPATPATPTPSPSSAS